MLRSVSPSPSKKPSNSTSKPANSMCARIHATQLLGSPLYWINRELYDAYMALTKQSFGLLVTTMTRWWSPTTIRISGDTSVAGQMKKTSDGRVEFSFPERIVMIANHQVCSSPRSSHVSVRLSLTESLCPDLHGLALSLVGRLRK